MKTKIIQLTGEYFKLMRRLKGGYPTIQEKLNELLSDNQEIPDVRTIITKYFERTSRAPGISRPPRKKTESKRMFYGRPTIKVVYPRSGNVYEGRVKYWDDLCMIEPVKPDLAFWIVNRKYLESGDVVDLNVIPYEKQRHTKFGRELASEFR